jgi:NhaP-type Na+/H+ or K+/H+ antiporter
MVFEMASCVTLVVLGEVRAGNAKIASCRHVEWDDNHHPVNLVIVLHLFKCMCWAHRLYELHSTSCTRFCGRSIYWSAPRAVSTRNHIDLFWELMVGILNAVFFVLPGLEIVLLSLSGELFGLNAAVFYIALCARWLTVRSPVSLATQGMPLSVSSWKVLRAGEQA